MPLHRVKVLSDKSFPCTGRCGEQCNRAKTCMESLQRKGLASIIANVCAGSHICPSAAGIKRLRHSEHLVSACAMSCSHLNCMMISCMSIAAPLHDFHNFSDS